MLMDVADTPIFDLVTINGLLTFKRGMNITFRTKQIFVRAGELHVGSKADPFVDNCNIILYGGRYDKAMAFTSSIEAGNKVIANINTIKMYGKARNQTLTRLLLPALKGDTSFSIEKNLDVVPGDRLALLATSFANMASD